MSKVEYSKEMLEFIKNNKVPTVEDCSYTPETIKFFQEQNDKYEFTIEDSAFGGSYEDDVMEYGDSEDEWYID
jgi:hypothetical protein